MGVEVVFVHFAVDMSGGQSHPEAFEVYSVDYEEDADHFVDHVHDVDHFVDVVAVGQVFLGVAEACFWVEVAFLGIL